MAKLIISGREAREKIISGTNQLADAVTTTLGPKGMNVALGKFWTDSLILHDGVSVAKEIELPDKAENVAAQLIRQAAERTNNAGGDGTTGTTLLTQSIIVEGMKLIENGVNGQSLKKGMQEALKVILEQIDKANTKIETKEKIQQVAMISSQDKDMGKIVAEAVWAVGKQGTIDVQGSSKFGLEYEIKEGMEFEKGITSPRFATTDDGVAELENVKVLLLDHPIASAKKLTDFLEKILKADNQPFQILIMADKIDTHSLETLLTNKDRGAIIPLFIQSPGFAERRREYLGDIASLTGARVVDRKLGMNLDNIDLTVLGSCEKVVSTDKTTKIVGGYGQAEDIKTRVTLINKQIEDAESEYDEKIHKERIAKLTAGVAVMKVGGLTEVEMKDNVERVIDAVGAAKSAFKDGVVYGGGRLLWEISDYLEEQTYPLLDKDTKQGYELLIKALRSPFNKLMENCGYVIDPKTKFKKGEGIDAMTGQQVDLMDSGIIDPTKVVLNSIKNAVSVGAMLLITKVIIVDLESPEEQQARLEL